MARAYQGRAEARWFESDALLLQRRLVGEADLLLSLFTKTRGRIAARARNAAQSQKRFSGGLQPLHTLKLRLQHRGDESIFSLQEATLQIPRQRLCANLEAIETGATWLGWLRESTPEAAPDPMLWQLTEQFLDSLEATDVGHQLVLGEYGLELLAVLGWGLDFERCVGCGKPCTPQRSALLSAHRGGLVCRACGGASHQLSGEQRRRFKAAAEGEHPSLDPSEARSSLELVKKVLQVHGNTRR